MSDYPEKILYHLPTQVTMESRCFSTIPPHVLCTEVLNRLIPWDVPTPHIYVVQLIGMIFRTAFILCSGCKHHANSNLELDHCPYLDQVLK